MFLKHCFHRAFSLRPSLLVFESIDDQARDALSGIKETERQAGEVQTFSSKAIEGFLKEKNITHEDAFDEEFRLHRIQRFLDWKKSHLSLTPDEQTLLSFYNAPGTTPPSIDLDDLCNQSAAPSSPLASRKAAFEKLRLTERMGVLEIREMLLHKTWQKQARVDARSEVREGLDENLKDMYRNLRRNWGKLSTGGKWFMVIGGLIGFNMLKDSKNDALSKARTWLWGAAKIGFFGFFANKLTQLITGKTAGTWINEMTSEEERNVDIISDKFNAEKEESRIFNKGIVFLDTLKVSDIFSLYPDVHSEVESARRPDESLVQLAKRRPTLFRKFPRVKGMKSAEVYIAVDVFMRRYGNDGPVPANLENRYRSEPDVTFPQMVAREMVDDPDYQWADGGFLGEMARNSINAIQRGAGWTWEKIKDACNAIGLSNVTEKVGDFFTATYKNYKIYFQDLGNGVLNVVKIFALTGVALIWAPAKIINLAKGGVDKLLDRYVNAYNDIIGDYIDLADVPAYFSTGKLGYFQDEFEKAYDAGFDRVTGAAKPSPAKALHEGRLGPAGAVVGGAYYYVEEVDPSTKSGPDGIRESIEKAYAEARSYFTTTHSLDPDHPLEIVGSCTTRANKFYLFVRAPMTDSVEFHARKTGTWKDGDSAFEMRSKDLIWESKQLKDHESTWLEFQVASGIQGDFTSAAAKADVDRFIDEWVKSYLGVGYTKVEIINKLWDITDAERNNILTAIGSPTQIPGYDIGRIGPLRATDLNLRKFLTDRYDPLIYAPLIHDPLKMDLRPLLLSNALRQKVLTAEVSLLKLSPFIESPPPILFAPGTLSSVRDARDKIVDAVLRNVATELDRQGKLPSGQTVTGLQAALKTDFDTVYPPPP